MIYSFEDDELVAFDGKKKWVVEKNSKEWKRVMFHEEHDFCYYCGRDRTEGELYPNGACIFCGCL